jgi:hypothetical protein
MYEVFLFLLFIIIIFMKYLVNLRSLSNGNLTYFVVFVIDMKVQINFI